MAEKSTKQISKDLMANAHALIDDAAYISQFLNQITEPSRTLADQGTGRLIELLESRLNYAKAHLASVNTLTKEYVKKMSKSSILPRK